MGGDGTAERLWRVVNPAVAPLAGLAPWWVLLETTGRRTGRRRCTPLAVGPREPDGLWLVAVRGRGSAWVRNLEAGPWARLRRLGRWRSVTAQVRPWDPAVAARFSRYARWGPRALGRDPVLVWVTWTEPERDPAARRLL